MASIKQMIERRDNIASIVSYVRSRGKATRMEISSALSLSWACVSDLTACMISEGILCELSKSNSAAPETKGRIPTYLALCENKYFLGVDINDTGFAITVLSLSGKRLCSRKWAPERLETTDELIGSVCRKIEEMMSGNGECLGIGVAMEGRHSEDGSWGYPLACGVVQMRPEIDIERYFGLPVLTRHDPECMLYAAAESLDVDCMVVRVDTGIGVAAMKKGRILELPLELGFIKTGDTTLRRILKASAKEGDHTVIARELGLAAANLAWLLGVKKVYLVGKIIEWLADVREEFDKAFRSVDERTEYEISTISDASEGAAKVAMAEYPVIREV